jgi:phospholipase/carboxylesterase
MKRLAFTFILLMIMNATMQSNSIKVDNTMLHYIVREPKIKQVHPPVLILLHGIGSNENDLFSFAAQLPDKFLIVSVRAPYTISEGSYAWYDMNFSTGKPVINSEQAEKSRNTLIQFIDQLKQKHPFDDKQVYLCGFSQGAIMSYSVGLSRPDKVKAIAIMSGRLLEEVKPLIATTENLKQIHVFIAHGTNDNVLSVQYARQAHEYLNQLGIKANCKEYPEEHTISNDMFVDLNNWLKGMVDDK